MLTRLVDVTLERGGGLKICLCKSSPRGRPATWVSSSRVRDYGEQRTGGMGREERKGGLESQINHLFTWRGAGRQGL